MRQTLQVISLLMVGCFVLSSCYLSPPDTATPEDPLEHLNRDTTRLNTKLDDAIIKPVAKGYVVITPYIFRKSLNNFFTNLEEPANVVDDLLQGHGRWALNDAWRFVLNSTIGVGGLYDTASHMRLVPHGNDFGLTLNTWHVYTAYFMVPFAGPRTLGSTLAIPADYYFGLEQYYIPLRYSIVMTLTDGLNTRANLLNVEKTAGGLILDRYTFYRSAYLQRRAYLLRINNAGPTYPVDTATS